MHVLVVEDDLKMAALLRRGLLAEGINCRVLASGEEALEHGGGSAYDVVVLDVGLPGMDGFETCARLRERGDWTPVLMLTARDSVADRVAGLDSGADDYLVKPFALAELLARLRALARRGGAQRSVVLEQAGLRLDPLLREVWRGDEQIDLSRREFALLETFMRHPGLVLSRAQLMQHVWSYDFVSESNVVDVYVRYLREKVDRPFGTTSIETLRGEGYRMRRTP